MKAIALVTESVMHSRLKGHFERECERAEIALEFYCVTESCARYSELFRSHRNVITWNCRMPHEWMRKWGNNVLYIENSLLWQKAGIFIDHRGFFSQSNLCVKRAWEDFHSVDLDAFTRQHFKWGALSGGNPDGPILVCLQNPKDSNLQMEFPSSRGNPDKLGATLDILYQHLPISVPITIRPHPRFLEAWNAKSYPMRSNWTVDWSGSFYDLLPRCSALVTVNSTCASEAVTLGIPVATLGTGAFTGSGATLECADNPARLRELERWQPSPNRCRQYAEAILGRHFLPYNEECGYNSELESWLRAAI